MPAGKGNCLFLSFAYVLWYAYSTRPFFTDEYLRRNLAAAYGKPPAAPPVASPQRVASPRAAKLGPQRAASPSRKAGGPGATSPFAGVGPPPAVPTRGAA